MRTASLILMMMLLPLSAYAGGKKNDGSNSMASANATAVSNPISNSGADAHAEGGAAHATGGAGGSGGAATIESGAVINKLEGGDGGMASASNDGVRVSTEVPRQAPSVGLVAPVKAGYKCLGWGGSNETGSTVIGYCWKQRDEWALERAEYLAGLGLAAQAASAYCSKRVHRKAFDGDCESTMRKAYVSRAQPRPAIHMRINPQQQCESRAYGETTIKEVMDDGTTLYYECAELPPGK